MVILFFGPATAKAAELSIQDISGVTRSLTDIEELGQIQFDLVAANGAAAEGAEITLTNSITGEVLKATSLQGVATFEGVAPGVWTVASSTAGVTFTNITVVPAALAAAGAAAAGGGIALGTAATGTAALAGIGGATVLASNELSNDSNDNELSPFD